jgi:hypothetical protein
MPICKICGDQFSGISKDENGKRIDGRKRVYCFKCNPKGCRNFWGGKPISKKINGKRDRTYYKSEKICVVCGKKYISATNLKCSNCINKKVRKERKEKAYQILGSKCSICGYDKCSDALDIHHKNKDDKKLTFSSSWGIKWEDIKKELEKCILLCCRCHRELHAKENNASVVQRQETADLKSAQCEFESHPKHQI